VFYTTPTDDGAIAVTCDLCYAAVSCPDPWAAAAEITTTTATKTRPSASPRTTVPGSTATSLSCTWWPAAGWLPAPRAGSSSPPPQPGPSRPA